MWADYYQSRHYIEVLRSPSRFGRFNPREKVSGTLLNWWQGGPQSRYRYLRAEYRNHDSSAIQPVAQLHPLSSSNLHIQEEAIKASA